MTKVISVSDEAYDRLKREKRENDSFSKAIIRLTEPAGKKNDILTFVKSIDPSIRERLAKNVEAAYKKMRKLKFKRVEF
ncbi:MAG: antitoxin VapB family protein [Candidatus Diapherotrites archaeon]|nr:antitoxin VapB family protein [Candidatus Diapherotrites archaeon]